MVPYERLRPHGGYTALTGIAAWAAVADVDSTT